jgi:hypothetical protein
MNRCPLLVFLILLLAASPCVGGDEFKLEPGFQRLDTGKDLAGWYPSNWLGKNTGDATGWSVVDGAIHLDCEKAKCHLFSEKKLSPNAVLRLDFRAAKAADSGLCLHGAQFQLRDYPNSHPDTKRYAPHAKPPGQWNALELDITDGVAVIRLNGQVIEKAWKLGPDRKRGLGLQRERGDVDFRYVRIKEKEKK